MTLTEDGFTVRNSGRADIYEHGPGPISGPATTWEEARAAPAAAPAPAPLTGRLDEVTAPAAKTAPAVQAAPQAPVAKVAPVTAPAVTS